MPLQSALFVADKINDACDLRINYLIEIHVRKYILSLIANLETDDL